MVAFALRSDGWYLRSDIIWSKPNSMPQSVKDRPTVDYDHIFLLTKNQKYYYDYEAVKEPASPKHYNRYKSEFFVGSKESQGANRPNKKSNTGGKLNVLETRNLRSVWTISTANYKGAHTAVFPTKLVETCIRAGSPTGGVVLDPFCGSGTTGEVAVSLGRKFVGIELNEDYCEMSSERIKKALLQMPLEI